MPFVGLTGGMGAGKSTALEALRASRRGGAVERRGRARALRRTSSCATRWWPASGAEVAPGGVVDRAAVAQRAFARAEERAWLEGLVWPLVGARVAGVARAGARAKRPAPRAAVVEVPLLFEAGLDELLRRDDRGRRGRSRSAGARADARGHALVDERVARQLPQEEKARRATFVVRNDGSEEDLERELSAVLAKL